MNRMCQWRSPVLPDGLLPGIPDVRSVEYCHNVPGHKDREYNRNFQCLFLFLPLVWQTVSENVWSRRFRYFLCSALQKAHLKNCLCFHCHSCLFRRLLSGCWGSVQSWKENPGWQRCSRNDDRPRRGQDKALWKKLLQHCHCFFPCGRIFCLFLYGMKEEAVPHSMKKKMFQLVGRFPESM